MFLPVSIVLALPCICAPAQTIEWTFPTNVMAVSPTLYPNAERPVGVITAVGKDVFLLDGKGQPLWTAMLPTAVAQPLAVADIDGKGDPETLAALANGTTVCLDNAGRPRWTADLQAQKQGLQMPAVSDVHPSPGLETVVSRLDGWVFCLAADGRVLWRFFGDRFRAGIPAIGDVDGDSFAEVVYGTDNGHVYCLDGNGHVRWRWTGNMPFGRSGINLADLNGDGKAQVLLARSNAGRDCGLFALDGANGKMLWHAPTEMQEYISLATVDLDGDGKMETIHGDKGNFLYCTNADGTERWRKELSGRGVFCAPTIGDVDGDGKPESLVGVRDNDPITGASHFLVRADGSEAIPVKLGGGGNTATAMGDLDGDGVLEVVAATPGALQCVSWGGKGRALWASLRCSSAINGRVSVPMEEGCLHHEKKPPSDLQIDVSDCYWGENASHATWKSPAPANAFLEVAVGQNAVCSDISTVPVAEGATSASFNLLLTPLGKSMSATVRLLASGNADPLACGFKEMEPLDLLRHSAFQQFYQTMNTRNARAGSWPSRAIQVRHALLCDEMVTAGAIAGSSAYQAARKSTEFRRLCAQSVRLLNALSSFWDSEGNGSFVCWQDANPWDSFDPRDMPERFEKAPPIAVTAFGDEFEDVALNLLNITDRPVDVRCVFTKPKVAGGAPDKDPELAKRITLRRGMMVAAPNGGMVLDALPELDLSRTITLTPLEASQLWLVVDTHGLAAGTHTLTLYLGSLEENLTLREIPVTIEVLPIRLPEGVYAQMNWVGTDVAETSDQQLKDMLDHGISVAYGPRLPAVPVDAQGAATGVVNWTSFDAALARLPGWFQLLFPAVPTVQWPGDKAPAKDSAEAAQGFATAVRALTAHLAGQGYGYDRWAFYPYDEPWLTGQTIIPDLRRFCERVKAADPQVRNYTDPTGLMRVEYVAEFKDLIDVWQPEINVLKRDPELLKWFQQNARTLWAYEATDPGKNMLPLGYYRAHAWTAWKLGLKGAGFWCYKYNDTWWPLETPDWSVVYQTGDQVTPSRRWEACRDGQEDYRALYALRAAAETARAAGQTAAADRALAAIDEMVEQVVGWQVRNIDEITRQTRDYEIDYELIKRQRARIAAEILALQTEETKQ
jgi:outer membrane protein assembly factor BamB